MADQLAPHFTGVYGHKIAKTPHIDALAARGMRFDAAYCNSPLCAPSRFAFMSGQLISRIAAYDNASEFRAIVPTFAHYLKALGYRTGLSGKMHFVGPDQKHGFEDRVTTDIYPADFAWTPDWEAHDERIDKWYHNMQTVKESGCAVATFQTDYDDEVEFAARRWLIDRGRDRAGGDVCRRGGAALEQREVARRFDRYAALSPGIARGDGSRGRRAVGLQSAARRDTGICTKPYGLDRSGGALSLPAIEREREWGRFRARWRW
jgi:arylsulfatase A-like enzyme